MLIIWQMEEFQYGPFTYHPKNEVRSLDGRINRVWELRYRGALLSQQTIRAKTRNSVVVEVFESARNTFTEQMRALHKNENLVNGWIAGMLPAEVLSADPNQWRAPNHHEMAHIVGLGSFTGITGEKAAELTGVCSQNVRKFTAREGANTRQRISYAAWHLLLIRLRVQPV